MLDLRLEDTWPMPLLLENTLSSCCATFVATLEVDCEIGMKSGGEGVYPGGWVPYVRIRVCDCMRRARVRTHSLILGIDQTSSMFTSASNDVSKLF
jgi:hypothetical protein